MSPSSLSPGQSWIPTAILAGVLAVLPAVVMADPWSDSIDHDESGHAVARFVPPELYAGAPWDGERALVLRPMNVTTKPLVPPDHPAITIIGPKPWAKDETVMVLERVRVSRREGRVAQIFAINERGDGLGRLSDERGNRSRPRMDECFKFPLGVWRQGETRTCRESTIVIQEIDFTYAGVAHALKFRWNDEGSYVFAPGRGMIALTH